LSDKCEERRADCQNKFDQIFIQLANGSGEFGVMNNRINNLEQWQKTQNGTLKEICELIRDLRKDLHDLNLSFVVGRPSWAITIILGIAATIIGSTITAFLILRGGL